MTPEEVADQTLKYLHSPEWTEHLRLREAQDQFVEALKRMHLVPEHLMNRALIPWSDL